MRLLHHISTVAQLSLGMKAHYRICAFFFFKVASAVPSLIPISSMSRMRHVGGWIVNESCCQLRAGSDRLDRADGRGWWAEQLWNTSMSAGRIHLIINAFQLTANKREGRGYLALLSRGRRLVQTWRQIRTNMCLRTHLHARGTFCMFMSARHTNTHTPR